MGQNCMFSTAPMGWNSYDYYDTTVTEADVMRNADYMAAHLKEYGWEYIVVDIQWYAPKTGSRRKEYQYIPFSCLAMDEYSRLLPDPERFPSSSEGKGFAPLADYVHSRGLKFGIHIMRGIPRQAAHAHSAVLCCEKDAAEIADPSSICRWNPDMYGVRNTPEGQKYYDSLIELYASWGVDYIKCDDICNTNAYPHAPYSARHEVEMLASAIRKSGREIVLSLSPGPALIEEAWHYENYANMWRITDDFWDQWELLKDMFRRCELWQNHVSPGNYPDCDMLPLGWLGKGFGEERRTNFTKEEQKTMMTLWCIFGSPLMLGAEMTKLDDETAALLTNRALLEMRDVRMRPVQIRRDDTAAVWEKRDAEGALRYLALFNLSEEQQTIEVLAPQLENRSVEGMDIWEGQNVTQDGQKLTAVLPAHGCAAFRIR